jgi:hypothetical protein
MTVMVRLSFLSILFCLFSTSFGQPQPQLRGDHEYLPVAHNINEAVMKTDIVEEKHPLIVNGFDIVCVIHEEEELNYVYKSETAEIE